MLNQIMSETVSFKTCKAGDGVSIFKSELSESESINKLKGLGFEKIIVHDRQTGLNSFFGNYENKTTGDFVFMGRDGEWTHAHVVGDNVEIT